jgi:hypothetical protein
VEGPGPVELLYGQRRGEVDDGMGWRGGGSREVRPMPVQVDLNTVTIPLAALGATRGGDELGERPGQICTDGGLCKLRT